MQISFYLCSIVDLEVKATKTMIKDMLEEDLSDMKANEDKTLKAVMLTLSTMHTSVHVSLSKLLLLTTCCMIEITFQHGICECLLIGFI